MHKINRLSRAEKDVYRQPLPKFGYWHQNLRCVDRPSVIEPDQACCIMRCTFLLTHIFPRVGDKLKIPTIEPFYAFSFDDTEEKVAVRFEGEKDQDEIYEITLCQYLDPENELPINPSIRFLCVAHPA